MGNKLVVSGFFLFFCICALFIPVLYPTTTLWYKYDLDRLFLYSGHYAGMIAYCCIYLQIALGIRGAFLDKTFGTLFLLKWHKRVGVVILLLGFFHLLLILLPEGLDNLPLGLKYWPQLVGLALFILIILIVCSGLFKNTLKLSHVTWRGVHRVLAYCCFLLLHVHILFVSDTFSQLVPKLFVSIFLLLFILLFMRMVMSRKSKKKSRSS